MKLVGAIKWVNEALKGMRFTAEDEYDGNGKLTVKADDRGNNGMGGALTDTENLTLKIEDGKVRNWRDWWNRREA